MQLQRLDHITITTNNPETSIAFYKDVLGLEPTYEWPGEITMLRAGETYLAIAWWENGKASTKQPPITIHHFAFRVDAASFETAKAELPKRGVPIERIEDHGNCMSIYFRDPDNHYVELTCYEIQGKSRMPTEL